MTTRRLAAPIAPEAEAAHAARLILPRRGADDIPAARDRDDRLAIGSSRREVLRLGLAVALGGVAAGAVPLAAKARTLSNIEHCSKCGGMFLFDPATASVCPAGEAHARGTLRYHLHEFSGNIENTQANWRVCFRCLGVFFGGNGRQQCPLTGDHGFSRAFNYTLDTGPVSYNIPKGINVQSGWRRCSKCNGLFFKPNGPGVCPADGGHDGSASLNYRVHYRA